MSNPQQSLLLFNQAIEMKRKGYFNEAIKLYVESVLAYPEDPKGMEAFYAMGKVFYLKDNPSAAIKCYIIYNRLCVAKSSQILEDFVSMEKGDSNASFQLYDAYYNLANHLGWTYHKKNGDTHIQDNEKIYRDSLLAKDTYFSLPKEKKESYDEQEKHCIGEGYQLIFNDFKHILSNPKQANAELSQYIDDITLLARNASTGNEPQTTNAQIQTHNEHINRNSAIPKSDNDSTAQSLKELGDKYEAEKNYTKSIEYYKKAAELGNAEAQFKLGDYYLVGVVVEQNDEEAVKWCRKAAEQGYAPAEYALGYVYDEGVSVEQNYEEAAKWYEKAAEKGNADAQFALGNFYFSGLGVKQNKEEAKKWFQKAVEKFKKGAEQGDANAQFALGFCYEFANTVEQNYEEAEKWYTKSAQQGNAEAKTRLNELKSKMNKSTPDTPNNKQTDNEIDAKFKFVATIIALIILYNLIF